MFCGIKNVLTRHLTSIKKKNQHLVIQSYPQFTLHTSAARYGSDEVLFRPPHSANSHQKHLSILEVRSAYTDSEEDWVHASKIYKVNAMMV